jgi:hypothetical protein
MSSTNDHSELRPTTPESADDTPKKRAVKSTVKSPAKAPAKSSARARAASSAAASEKTDKPAPKRRGSTASTTADPSAKAAPRLHRTPSDIDAAANETFVASAAASALDPHDDAALNGGALTDSLSGLQYIEEEVRVRAYMLSLARGDQPGSPDTDWFQAEREVAQSRQL